MQNIEKYESDLLDSIRNFQMALLHLDASALEELATILRKMPAGSMNGCSAQIVDLMFAGHKERDTTLVLVTHDAALARRCDRVVRLRSGTIDSVERTS